MAMTKQERVRATLAGAAVDRPAVSMWGHDYLREWSQEGLVAATLEQYRAHDWDFIKLNPRWTMFAEAWGAEYQPPDGQENPRAVSRPVHAPEDLDTILPVDPTGGPFAEHLRGLRMLLEEVGDEVDVIQTLFSPLAVTAMLAGRPSNIQDFAAEDPARVHRAMAAVAQALAAYGAATIEAGASGVFYAPLFWSSYDTCSEDLYREYGRPYDLQVLSAVRDAPFNVLHVCQDHNMLELLLDYPVAAFNWDDHGEGNRSLADVRALTDKAVMGGIDRANLDTAPDATSDEVRSILAEGHERTFVTGGCAVSPAVGPEPRALVAAAARAG